MNRTLKFDVFNINYKLLMAIRQLRDSGDFTPPPARVLKVKTTYPNEPTNHHRHSHPNL